MEISPFYALYIMYKNIFVYFEFYKNAKSTFLAPILNSN